MAASTGKNKKRFTTDHLLACFVVVCCLALLCLIVTIVALIWPGYDQWAGNEGRTLAVVLGLKLRYLWGKVAGLWQRIKQV